MNVASEGTFLRRVLMAALAIGFIYAVWQLSFIFLLAFAAILAAALITGLSALVERHTPLNHRWALVASWLGLLGLFIAIGWLFGSQATSQLLQFIEKTPAAIDAAGERIGVESASQRLIEALPQDEMQYFLRAASAGYAIVNGVGQFVLVLMATIYIAADPALYKHGAVALLPPRVHGTASEAFDAVATALRLWFVGQLASMVFVGVLSALAYWIIGLPIPLGLGVVAGITNFIPVLGPFIGGIPAVVFALQVDLQAAAWTVGAIFLIQQVDGYVASPLIQKQVVSLPPALLLFALVAFGVLFGTLGVVLAAPMTVAATVLVQKLWVREFLGEPVEVIGERNRSA